MRRGTNVLILATVLLLAATPSLATVISLEATDASGEPLAQATIQIGDVEARTDRDGRATLDIPADEGEEVKVLVTFQGERVYEQAVTVSTGRTIRVQTSVVGPGGPLGGSPAGGFGPGSPGTWGGRRPAVLATFRTERVETELAAQSFDVTTTTGGTTTPGMTTPGTTTPGSTTTTSGTLSPEELAEARATEKKRHEIPIAYGVDAVFPIPAIGGGTASQFLRPFVGGLGSGLPAYPAAPGPRGALYMQDDDAAGGGGGGGARFFPAATAGIANADVEFHSENLVTGQRTTFKGDGLLYRLGIQGTLVGCEGCRWFGTLAYEHAWTEDIDVDRNPSLLGQVPQGISLAEDKISYSSRADTVRLVAGRAFGSAAPWFGVRGQRWRGELEMSILLTNPANGAQQRQRARNEYEEDLFQFIAGVDLAVPRSKVVVRIEGATDGDSWEAGAGVGVAF